MKSVCIAVSSLQPLPASISCPSSLHSPQPSFTTVVGPISSSPVLASLPQATQVLLVEHLRRLKHGTPTSPQLAATLSSPTSAEPFQTSHDVGLKDLLLSNDDDITNSKTGATSEPEKSAQLIRQSPTMSTSTLVAANGLAGSQMFEVTGQHLRPAIILKQLLEDRADPTTSSSPNIAEPFDVGPRMDQGVAFDSQKTNSAETGAKRSLSVSDQLMFGYNSPMSMPSTSPSSLLQNTQVQPPFVQLITSVEDAVGMKQSSPPAPLTFSIAELTSVSHLWSPPSFTSQLTCANQIATPSSFPQSHTASDAQLRTGIHSLMSMASSQSLVTMTSSSGLQLKVAPPRMAASRNVLLRVSICLELFFALIFCIKCWFLTH